MGKKILIGVICFFILGVIAFLGVSFYFGRIGSIKHESNEVMMTSNKSENKKALLVYQPGRGDTSHEVAKSIAEGIKDSGYDVTMNYVGDYLPKSTEEYDLIVIGTTVYMGQVSKNVQEYVENIDNYGDGKLVIYSKGSAEESPELEELEKSFNSKKPDKKFKINVSEGNDYKKEAYEFGVEIAK